MRRLRQPARTCDSLLRLAIRQVFARPLLTGSLLLALAPAGQALTLGDISVRSTLGQRLDATVPVRLGAGEALASGCVCRPPGTPICAASPEPMSRHPRQPAKASTKLQVTSASALYEPMYELELKVQCPGRPS